MVPDIIVKAFAAGPVAADKGTVPPAADGHPIFGEALRAACSESDAPVRPSSGRPRDARRGQGDASAAAWWACPRSAAAGSTTAVGDAEAAGVDQAPFVVPGNEATDAAPADDDGSSATDLAAALPAIEGQPIVEAQAARAVPEAGVETGDWEGPGVTTSCASDGEASTAEDVGADSQPQAAPSMPPVPSAVEADSAQASDATAIDRTTGVPQARAGADVNRPVEERIEADVQSMQSDESGDRSTAPRKMLDVPASSSAHQPVDARGGAEAPKTTVPTETSVAVTSSGTSLASEAGSQTLPLAAAAEGAESAPAAARESLPTPADAGHSVSPQSPGGGAGERQAEHGRSDQDQQEHLWRPYVSPYGLAGKTPALFAPGLALLQGSDGILTLMPAAPALAQPAAIPAENLDQLVQTMRVMVRGNVSEATLRLRPEHLGDVSVVVRVDGRVVTATVIAESAGVREWLQLHEEALRTGLQQQGLTLDRLVVQREARQERREQPHPDARRSRPRRGQDPQPRFEVSA